MQKPYQAVIFDMDGLIVDTENIYYNTYNQTLNELGIDIPREGYVRCVGHPVENNSEDAVKRYDLPIRPEDFHEAWMIRFETAISDPDQIDLMPGFLDLLSHLQNKHYKLGIASSTPRQRMRATLQNGVLPHVNANALHDILALFFPAATSPIPNPTRKSTSKPPQNSMSRPKPVSYLKTARLAYNLEKPQA